MPCAIDFHVHLPTTEFMQVTLGSYAQAAERFFRTEVMLKEIEQIAADYAELDMIGVLLAWDAETATGLPPLSNDYIAEIIRRYPHQFVGFASVDPHKGKVAVYELFIIGGLIRWEELIVWRRCDGSASSCPG